MLLDFKESTPKRQKKSSISVIRKKRRSKRKSKENLWDEALNKNVIILNFIFLLINFILNKFFAHLERVKKVC